MKIAVLVKQVPDTETTILFHVEDDVIFLATSGWSGLPWPDVLKEMQSEIERQISDMGMAIAFAQNFLTINNF